MNITAYDKALEQIRYTMRNAAGSVSESITLEGKEISIEIKHARNCIVKYDGDTQGTRMAYLHRKEPSFASLFRKYNKEFVAMLDKLSKKADVLVSIVENMCDVVIEKELPDLILDRLAGNNTSKADIIHKIAGQKMEMLINLLPDVPKGFMLSFYFGGLEFQHIGERWEINIGDLISSAIKAASMSDCLTLIANFQKYVETTTIFAKHLETFLKGLSSEIV